MGRVARSDLEDIPRTINMICNKTASVKATVLSKAVVAHPTIPAQQAVILAGIHTRVGNGLVEMNGLCAKVDVETKQSSTR